MEIVWKSRLKCLFQWSQILNSTLQSSVVELWHFSTNPDADPDPRIREAQKHTDPDADVDPKEVSKQ